MACWLRGSASALAVAALLAAGCAAQTDGRPEAAPVVSAPPTSSATAHSAQRLTPPSGAPASPASVSTPCTHNQLHKWVFVSIRQQHMWMCARHRAVADTAITTGMAGQYTNTPTGSYRIQGRSRNTTLTLNTGATYAVKYWIPFDGPLFGFHDSSWQRFPYGSNLYRTRGSHGCVHMPLKAISFLYRWADIGTPVRIRR